MLILQIFYITIKLYKVKDKNFDACLYKQIEQAKDFISYEINRGKTTAVKLLNKLIAKNLIEHIGTSKYDNKGTYIIKK